VPSPVPQSAPSAAFIASEVVLFAGIDTPSGDMVAVANTIIAVDVKDIGLLQLDVLLPAAVNGYVKGAWAVTIMESPAPVIGDRSMAYSIAKTSDSGRSYIEMLAFVQYDVLVIVTVASTGQSYDTLAETVRLAQIVSSRITAYQYPTPVPMTTLEG
jgi:hypothetical protein